ncbi:hypothetical protein HPB48_014549 [Haemaphysalis longicornis]|uniref:TRAF1-6 MATH domain-containing protein n=1 Tax=Haemaphysalis longicornis TaxID=44386 RepID=A0A9J6G963_HAELO|nr:hypothetical protein HPB48_014549 [Haemaphysalis longicornis]
MSSVLSMVVINQKAHRWNFTGYAGHKADAIKKGWFWELGAKVYLQRYLIRWGIQMATEDGHVNLYLLFQLHNGRNDEYLNWPFSNKLKLCLIHPETQQDHCATHQPNVAAVNNKFYARPLKDSNESVYLSSAKFDASYIEKNGFIKEDKLLLKLEVLS